MKDLNEIEALIKSNKLNEALVLLSKIIAEDGGNARALYLRGKTYWRMGERAKATSDYAASSLLEPEGPATQALRMARDIESFFNPDLLNP